MFNGYKLKIISINNNLKMNRNKNYYSESKILEILKKKLEEKYMITMLLSSNGEV